MSVDGKTHVLLAGGGTGGHVFPALAVAEELAGRGCAVSFAGSAAGLEGHLVPSRGFPFHALPARALVGRGPVGKLLALATVARGALAAARLVRRQAVAAVLGTGGYVSAPAVLGAVLARRPVLLLEPNAVPGVANRRVARWAKGAAVAFEETRGAFPCPTRVTGVPLRREFFREAEPAAAAPPERAGIRILVLGGSQGALALNRSVPRVLAGEPGGAEGLASVLPGVRVVHQSGPAHLELTREAYREAGVPDGVARIEPFIEDVAAAMAECELVISRAGALTVAEIAAAGRAAVLVPLALAGGHQRDNARALERAGAARVVEAPAGQGSGPGAGAELAPHQAHQPAPQLAKVLAELLAEPGARERLREMGRAARSLARPQAAAEVADWVLELARPAAAGAAPDGGRA